MLGFLPQLFIYRAWSENTSTWILNSSACSGDLVMLDSEVTGSQPHLKTPLRALITHEGSLAVIWAAHLTSD